MFVSKGVALDREKPNHAGGTGADILLVDDAPANLELLGRMLKNRGYSIRAASSGHHALLDARQSIPDLILLDINMGGMSGYEVCEQLKADDKLKGVPVIFISAISEPLDKVKAFAVGGVDYITKPIQMEELNARIRTHLEMRRLQVELEDSNLRLEKANASLEHLVDARTQEITEANLAALRMLAVACEARDADTGGHVLRIKNYSERLASQIGLTKREVRTIGLSAILHDVGKIHVPDRILLKPGPLTEQERREMQEHTLIGERILSESPYFETAQKIARQHHENWDGSGYPDGLRADEISIYARIVHFVDVYDALLQPRVYKPAWSKPQVFGALRAGRGSQFDPEIVDAFFKIEDPEHAMVK
jgi:putative two-component system response regulator